MLKMMTIAAATLVAVSASAFADQTDTSTMTFGKNMYVGVQAGYGKINIKTEGLTKNKGFVYGLNFGNMFTKNLGVELGAQKYSNVKADGTTEKDNYVVHLAAVATMPVASNISVYGEVGPAWVHGKVPNSVSISKITVFGELGAGYTVTQNIQLTLSAEGTTKHSDAPATYSANAGVNYIF